MGHSCVPRTLPLHFTQSQEKSQLIYFLKNARIFLTSVSVCPMILYMRDTQQPQERLSEPQLKVLRSIRDYVSKHGISPTYDEIAAATGRGKATTRRTIDRIIRKGLLTRGPWRWRNLSLTPSGQAAAANGRRRKH